MNGVLSYVADLWVVFVNDQHLGSRNVGLMFTSVSSEVENKSVLTGATVSKWKVEGR